MYIHFILKSKILFLNFKLAETIIVDSRSEQCGPPLYKVIAGEFHQDNRKDITRQETSPHVKCFANIGRFMYVFKVFPIHFQYFAILYLIRLKKYSLQHW